MSEYSYLFKFIVIGDSAVGKSCLLLQFTDQRFKSEHDVTIGVEFGARTVNVSGEQVKLQVWDTAGQESFRSITRAYYRGSAAALLVFDITNRTSFESIGHWLKEAQQNTSPQVTVMMVGNKMDLADQRQVSVEEAQRFAQANGMEYVEASAKTALNVDKCFMDPAARIMANIKQGVYDFTDVVLST